MNQQHSSLAESFADDGDLFCKPCHQTFSTIHNKREHMAGKRHAQIMAELSDKPNSKHDYPHSISPNMRNGGFNSNPSHNSGPKITVDGGGAIPVFSESFLEYSRQRESDLRQLRKSKSMFEEQNAVLNKQIEHMKNVIERVKTEIIQQENDCNSMQNYLEKFKKLLVTNFTGLDVPELTEAITYENAETYMSELVEYVTKGEGKENIELKNNIKELVEKLDYPSLKE